MQKGKFFHYSHLHLLVFIAGFTAILGKLISVAALPLVWYRMGMASLLIFLFVKIRKISIKFPKRAVVSFSLVGLVIALHWISFFWAIKVSNVSVTLAVISSGAFFVSFLEPIFFNRRIYWYEVLFGIMAIAGIYVIFSIETQYVTGILLALASAFFGGLFAVLNGKLTRKYDPVGITFYEMLAGTFFVTIFLFVGGELDNDWLYLFILASVCTAYAFIAGVHIMKWISPYTVMLTYNMEPVYGILLALIVFKDSEQMSPGFYYGALIILVTVVANGLVKMYIERKNKRISPE